MAKIYKANGQIIDVEPKNGTNFQLQELQEIVGGLIDVMATNDGKEVMVFNDEGKLANLPYNKIATEIYQTRIYDGDFLVGDVLMCKSEEVN